MPKYIENKFINKFKKRDFFSREELFNFFLLYEPDLKESTLAWRIYDLKKKNIIKSVRRGYYTISSKPHFEPLLSTELIKFSKSFIEKYQDVKYCVWETDWLNEFLQHQTSKRILIIEIEKEFVESLYFLLKDTFENDLYFNPKDKTIDFYITESSYPIVIKNLITRSPIESRTVNDFKVSTPFLEKILVDLFADERLYYLYNGSELINIYENAITNYTINFTKLFSYAKRRERKNEIKLFLTNTMGHLIKEILDD